MRYGAPLISGALVYGNTDLGVLGSVIRSATGSGDQGAGVLYNDWDSGADDSKRFRALIITPPSAGAFFMYEDGSFTLVGAPDGSYSVVYQLYVDGVATGSQVTDPVTVGSATSVVSSDLVCAYSLRAAVAADLTASYALRGALTADCAVSYAIRGAVTADMVASFQILSVALSQVLSDLSCSYAVRGSVLKDLVCSYQLLEAEPADTGEPVTLAEAKLAARVDGEDLDDLILGYITSAREQAEHITGRRYRAATLRHELVDWPRSTDAFPVHEATGCAISHWDGSGWVGLDAAAFVFAPGGIGNNGTVVAPLASWPQLGSRPAGPRVRVDITAGPASRASVPAQVKTFIKASVSAWVNNPDAVQGRALTVSPLFERLLDAQRLYG
jgi:uncharacterized phiE125 gp8 family phage protein